MNSNNQTLVFIKHLDYDVDESHIIKLFKDYELVKVTIVREEERGESCGYGFIEFKSHSDADEAISKLNHSPLFHKKILLTWYDKDLSNFSPQNSNCVFVRHIKESTSYRLFIDFFATFGDISLATLLKNTDEMPNGRGIIYYKSEESAKKAILEGNGKELNGNIIYVSQFHKGLPRRRQKNTIYVRNIPKSWTEEDVRKYFEKFGQIRRIYVKEFEKEKLNKYKALPGEMKDYILQTKFSFVYYVEINVDNIINRVPYYKIDDKEFNEKVDNIVEWLKEENDTIDIPPEDYYKFAAFLQESNVHTEVFENSELLQSKYSEFSKILREKGEYNLKNKSEHLECYHLTTKGKADKNLNLIFNKNTLYIQNLPNYYSNEDLKNLFTRFGQIHSANIEDQEQQVKGGLVSGFVRFFVNESAKRAMAELNGKKINGVGIKIKFYENKSNINNNNINNCPPTKQIFVPSIVTYVVPTYYYPFPQHRTNNEIPQGYPQGYYIFPNYSFIPSQPMFQARPDLIQQNFPYPRNNNESG